MSKKIKVLCWSDSPAVTTGFGVVAKELYKGFHDAGMEVVAMGTLATPLVDNSNLPYRVINACQHDPEMYELAPAIVSMEKPDVVFILADPGTAYNRIGKLFSDTPVVAYFPIEGSPVSTRYLDFIRDVIHRGGSAVTYTKWGADTISLFSGGILKIPYIYHGVDHAGWKPIEPELRKHMRKVVGWDDKFVVTFRGRNKGVKMQLSLMHAMHQLVHVKKRDDILLYLHCKPFEEYLMQGWNLLEWKKNLGLSENLLFPQDMYNQLDGVPFDSNKITDWNNVKVSDDPKVRGLNFIDMDLCERTALADLFIDPASIEGFGLPALEAAACGVPVATVNDSGVRSEIFGDNAYFMEPITETRWHTGAALKIVAEDTIGSTIELFSKNEKLCKEYGELGLERSKDFRWDNARESMTKLVEQASGKNTGQAMWFNNLLGGMSGNQ